MKNLAKETFDDVEQFFSNWLKHNEEIFRDEIKDKAIGDKNELARSFNHELKRLGEGFLEGGHFFLTRGRFVDMGVGRGHGRGALTSSSRSEGWSRGRKGRKPKKWYSPAFYGRLNDLMGATGARISEQAIRNIKEEFKIIDKIT